LKTFINELLSNIHEDKLSMETPSPDCWGIKGNEDSFIDLNSWNPRKTVPEIYKVIALPTVIALPAVGNLGILTPINPQWAALGGGFWPSRIKSIRLPSNEIFDVQGSHLMVVIHYRVKIKIVNKPARFEDVKHSMLIPANLKVAELAKAFSVNGRIVSRLIEIPETSNKIIKTDIRTATDLGWKQGTELRIEY
jgi:hypothetical protein